MSPNHYFLLAAVFTMLISTPIHVGASDSQIQISETQLIRELKTQGTLYGLRGQYRQADRIAERLKLELPDSAVGYTFHLNMLMTQLSWDALDPQFDQLIGFNTDKVFEICKKAIKADKKNYQAYFDCGQGHLVLTYLNAVRGNYYKAGVNGTKVIEYLERALEIKPDLIDAKMHLGAAYFFADNLPPYVKAVSYILWFVPTGNSSKSLPYVKEVAEQGDYFRDVSKYIYADLLIEGDSDARQAALDLLHDLVIRYPENRRFQLRYISLLNEMQQFDKSLQVIRQFIETQQQYNRDPVDISLAQLWAAQAFIGEKNIDSAVQAFSKTSWNSKNYPSWAKQWFLLTRAQLHDLQQRRQLAIEDYKRILSMDAVSSIVTAAKQGLAVPFTLTPLQ